MNRNLLLIIAVVLVIAVIGGAIVLNKGPLYSGLSFGTPAPLSAVEIRNYQGKDLSSINAFRENSLRGPQYVNISDYHLTITGLTNKTDVYSYNDVLEKYPHYSRVVTLHCVEGWDATILWEGVQVRDLIREAGPDPRADTVVFTAHDGYTTSFRLDYLMNRDILMAYSMNNVTLPPERGYPFELVAEDKWGYKWIKWIERIELTNDTAYRGYWEKRGFSNSGDLNKSYFSL